MGYSITQRQLVDRIARYLVSAGGIAVIVAILAIFFFIFREIIPLFSTPTARLLARVTLPSVQSSPGPARIGMDEHREIAYALDPGGVHFIDLATGGSVPPNRPRPQRRLLRHRGAPGHEGKLPLAAGSSLATRGRPSERRRSRQLAPWAALCPRGASPSVVPTGRPWGCHVRAASALRCDP